MNSEIKIISIIGLITLIIIFVGVYFSAGSATGPAVAIQQALLVRSDSPRIKAEGAKVQIVEFGDFQCPACAALAPNLKQLLDTYKGQIDYTFRIIPIHSHSKDAAAAAFAAGEQGVFFEMGDILFARQDEWSSSANPSTFFEKYASNLKLDMTKYKADYVNNRAKYDAVVGRDAKDATTMQINSTPTLIFNGTQVTRGSVPYSDLKAIVEGLINGAPEPVATSSTATSADGSASATYTTGSASGPKGMMLINGATSTPEYNPDGRVKVQRY